MSKVRVLIMGAAGRDFHNFNMFYRHNDAYKVVAFTATQIPDIEGRTYPPELSGKLYPNGIPIYDEKDLTTLIKEHDIDEVVFAYSDVTHEFVMHKASQVLAGGADYRLIGTRRSMLKSTRPVVGIGAVRTGCGKSQTTRAVSLALRDLGYKVAVVRHPMPYGDLAQQSVQRFADYDDLAKNNVTIEEREEYEPHLASGSVVFAGVDYEAVLREAEKEADVILWDGGNNDVAFFKPTVHITVVDPHRAGHELSYYPGEINVRLADAIIVNKIGTATMDDVLAVERNVRTVNPSAALVEAASPLFIEDAAVLRGKRVLCVEDGPTLTHGGMTYGAAVIGARKAGAAEIVDPRTAAVGEIADTFEQYPEIGALLPAMGYGEQQIHDLERTIRRAAEAGAEAVAIGTPIDLGRLIDIPVPHTRIRYELQVLGSPTLADVLEPVLG
jgi:predicted GTPase